MRYIPRIAPATFIAGFAILATGCGSVPPSIIDVTEGQALRPGEVLVIGRYSEIRDEDTVDFGEPHDWNFILVAHRDVSTLWVADSANVQTGVPLRNDGTFLWRLKPGEYRLIGTILYHAAGYISEYWNPSWTFNLLPGDSAVYIGNLITGTGGRQVKDEYQAAVQTLSRKVPGMNARPVIRLMRETSTVSVHP